MALSDRAEKEISVGSLDAPAAAEIEKFCGPLIVRPLQGQIRKKPELIPQLDKLGRVPDPGKDLLPDRSDQPDPRLPNQFPQLGNGFVGRRLPPTKSQRPDTRVNEHAHSRFR
jgi:hypothetical protein